MPTPPDTVETVTNADGSTTTTTTKFYPNGQPRQVTVETKDPNGNLREKNETNIDRQGKRKSEKNAKLDDQGRLDETTETAFDNKGIEKKRIRTEFDDQNRPTKTILEKFKDGTKTTSQTEDIDYAARPPKKVVISEKLCPDGIQVEKRITRVFFNRAGSWQEEKRQRTKEKFDCETGRLISFRFPQGLGDYATIGLTALTVVVAAAGWAQESNTLWLAALVSLVVAVVLYIRFESRQKVFEEEIGDLAFSICHDDEVAESDEEEPN